MLTFRPIWRAFVRNFSKENDCAKSTCEILMSNDHTARPGIYRILSLLVALPIVIGLTVTRLIMGEHAEPPRPFVPYDYLGIRNKRFPWGDGNTSFFHNPNMNRLPPYTIPYDDPLAEDAIPPSCCKGGVYRG